MLALHKHNGFQAMAAADLGIARSTLCNRIKKSPILRATLDDQVELKLDAAETALKKAVDSGEGWAVTFFLKCKGQKRGYVEKQQITVEGEIVEVRRVDMAERAMMIQELLRQRGVDLTHVKIPKILGSNVSRMADIDSQARIEGRRGQVVDADVVTQQPEGQTNEEIHEDRADTGSCASIGVCNSDPG